MALGSRASTEERRASDDAMASTASMTSTAVSRARVRGRRTRPRPRAAVRRRRGDGWRGGARANAAARDVEGADTIAGIATAVVGAVGGVAIVRLSGPRATAIGVGCS